MTTNDIDAIRQKWASQCGPCDVGLYTMRCACPEGDYRPVVAALCDEIEQLRDKIERRRARLVEAESDLLDVRGILSPNGYPQRVPVDLVPTVAPAVRWLADRVDELTAELEKVRAQLTAARQEVAR